MLRLYLSSTSNFRDIKFSFKFEYFVGLPLYFHVLCNIQLVPPHLDYLTIKCSGTNKQRIGLL